MTYVVRLESFEGPLDLLLYLIQREEMDIYDIPIARITEQYLQHVGQMEKLDLHPAGDFLVMAATLMRIKARMLLPLQRPGEDTDEEDPRQELVQRLLEYKKFKEAAKKLEERETERMQSFTRPLDQGLLEEIEGYTDDVSFEVSMSELMRALHSVLSRLDEVVTHEIELEPVALEDRILDLRQRLAGKNRLSWSELFDQDRTRLQVIVTFMGILELAKTGDLRIHQGSSFGELWIFRAEARPAGTEEVEWS